jgi:hypothetical protein
MQLTLEYQHRLIDDMVASAMKWSGGVRLASNYDGDVVRHSRNRSLCSLDDQPAEDFTEITVELSRPRHRDAPLPAPKGERRPPTHRVIYGRAGCVTALLTTTLLMPAETLEKC